MNEAGIRLLEAVIVCQAEAVTELGIILEDLLASAAPFPTEPRKIVLVAGTKRAQQTAEIIVELAKKRYVEDMAILSRTISETAINIYYLQICDENEFKRFMIFDPIADLKLRRELKKMVGHVPSQEAEAVLEKMAKAALETGFSETICALGQK